MRQKLPQQAIETLSRERPESYKIVKIIHFLQALK